jgi:hypothetical protein
MKGIWAAGLGLSLGWWVSGARGEDGTWRSAELFPPVIAQAAEPVGSRPLPVSLGRPVAVLSGYAPAAAPSDPAVQQTAYQSATGVPTGSSGYAAPSGPVGMLPDLRSAGLTRTSGAAEASTGAVIAEGHQMVPDASAVHAPSGWAEACCGEAAVCPCETPGASPSRFYGSGEYLLWWLKDQRVPPLVTTSPPASAGIIGMPGTQILFGGSDVSEGTFSGFRFTAGYWLDACHLWALEGSYFFLGDETRKFSASSSQFSVIARPFFNLNSGMEFSEVTVSPGVSTGRIDVATTSRLWGAEGNLRRHLCGDCSWRVDLLAGFRYLDLDEGLSVDETINALPGGSAFGGDNIFVNDRFHTHDKFYGGQLGVDAEYHRGPWFVDLRGKLALGGTRQIVDINGGQLIVTPTGTATSFTGGLLALPTNIGHFRRDRFGVLPEVGVNVGYQVTDHLRAFVGYNFLYLNSVVRPGDQIDRVIDITKIPNFAPPGTVPAPQARPAVLFRDTDFWAQGINFGLEFRY